MNNKSKYKQILLCSLSILSIMLLLILLLELSYYIFTITNDIIWAKLAIAFGFVDYIIGIVGLIAVIFMALFIRDYIIASIGFLGLVILIYMLIRSIKLFL